MRSAWDGRPLAILTRASPARASSAHIALIGHITQHELRRHTTQLELANGYLNRILLIACRRQRLLAEGGQPDPLQGTGLTRLLQATLKHAQRAGQVRLDADAREPWHHAYRQLAQPEHGIVGQITARAEAHTIRLALLYALTDGNDRSARRTCRPRSRSTTTPPAPPPGRSTARPASRSPNRSTPRCRTARPA